MTATELSAVIRGIAPVIREYVTKELSEATDRLAATEARVQLLGDVRDRVVTVETKVATLPAPDLSELRERILVLETRAATPDAVLATLTDRLATLERRTADGTIADGVTALRERVAVLEVKAPIPGPPGHDGADGQDGLGIQDLAVEFDGGRTLTLTFAREGVTKVFPVELTGYPLYRGVYVEGRAYAAGDRVTWAGCEWHCHDATTSKPGDGAKAWTLCVKRGRDGKDGRDGRDLGAVVKVG